MLLDPQGPGRPAGRGPHEGAHLLLHRGEDLVGHRPGAQHVVGPWGQGMERQQMGKPPYVSATPNHRHPPSQSFPTFEKWGGLNSTRPLLPGGAER